MTEARPSRPVPVPDPAHDGRHRLRDLPLERESIPYVLSLPEHQIGTFIYTWVDKDQLAGSVFVAFGPGIGEEPLVEAVDGVQVTPEQNFDDWRVGVIHLQQDLKMQKARISVQGERAALNAEYSALHPAYSYGSHPEGCPEWAAIDRLEQAGRMRGALTVDGTEYAFDTTGARDHSWGTRDWYMPQHWKWLHAQTGDDVSVHFWQIYERGRVVLRGYIFRDGVMAEVEAVDVSFTPDAQYHHRSIDAHLRDTAGRDAHVQGEFFGHFPLMPNPDTTMFEGAMRCTIDGKEGVGWSEFMWPTNYLAHIRGD